ncbi:MAG: methyltransferase [Verrucomicrobia bacterium]|jgi:uroporphyrinogen decarboxylase|nr:methyltransferase [Verrucomicrobiota bacterium]MBT7068010.1 methyltransferase [Verrucomicrobiota bacterium]MBT7698969.1 methyltransferase [Verrucomicrobiota bacterium]
MTSRERILAAIEHREPDAVPVDLGATPSSGISAMAYGNLKQHLAIEGGHTRIYDVVQQLAQPEEAVLGQFGVDVIDVGRAFNTKASDWYDIQTADGQTAQYPTWFRPVQCDDGSWSAQLAEGLEIARMPAGGAFYDQSLFPWLDAYPEDMPAALPDAMSKVLWSALVHSPWDHASEDGFWDDLRARTIALREASDRALMIVCGCNLFEWGTFLRRMDNFLMDLFIDEAHVEKLLDALMEAHMATLEKVCNAVGDVCDILRFGDDLGIDTGPFMPPELYRKLFKPRHTQLCGYVHAHSNMKTFLHSCGSIYKLMPDLIEAGYDVINPLQTNCVDMEPERMKREFGKDICFWGGGCDTRSVLNRATPAAVKAHVLQRLKTLSPGGGFVFNTVHNILPEVPPENVVAMFDAISEFNG